MTQTETLIGTLATAYNFHVGRYDHFIPAGTAITVEQESIEHGRAIVLARLISNPRIHEYVYAEHVIPA